MRRFWQRIHHATPQRVTLDSRDASSRRQSVLLSLQTELPRAALQLLRWTVLCVGLWFFWQLLSLVSDRVRYPGELEWMEGGVLIHVQRVTSGLPLYVEPSIEFTPYIYPPLYYWLCAALTPLFGLSLSLLRSVSFGAFVLSAAVIVYWAHRRTQSWVVGLTGAGLFSATFRLGGAWFDIARADSLMLLFVLAGGLALLEFRGRRSAALAAALFAAAVLTKQSALLPLAALSGWTLFARDRRLLGFSALAWLLVGLSFLALHLASDGWSTYYVFTLPSAHPILQERISLFWKHDVLGVLAIPALLLGFELVAQTLSAERLSSSLGVAAFAAGVVAQVWSSRLHMGMYDNVLMPMHALIALGCALALGRLRARSTIPRALEVASLVALLGVFWQLDYPIEAQRPTPEQLAQHEQLVERLAALPAGTWVPFHSWPAALAGQPPRAHIMALIDVQKGGGEVAARLRDHAKQWLAARSAPAIVWSLNDSTTTWFYNEMRRYYRPAGRLTGPQPLTGWKQRPTQIWVPR